MQPQRTIPDLEAETTYLSRTEAYTHIKNGLTPDHGIQFRCFKPGHDEWYEYYRENPSGDGLLFFREHHGVQNHPVREDVLTTIGHTPPMGAEYLKDIYLVPLNRMPQWGDGSVHYTCHICTEPIIATERTYTEHGTAHTGCSTTSKQ